MTIGFHTLGCKLNQYETEALAASFRERGHTVVTSREDADAFIINTCTVTCTADHKTRSVVRGLSRRNPRALLIVTGCAAQLEAEALAALGDNVLVVPQSRKGDLLGLAKEIGSAPEARACLDEMGRSSTTALSDPFAFRVQDLSFHTRAFMKIQDGCDGQCAYCRVPQARGSPVSLDADEVIRRTRDLESRGHREVVVTGVNISSYRSKDIRLPRLLQLMIEATGRLRLRLSSLEPEALTEELALVLADPRICPHFHIPVQSGSDSVLARMRRRYRSQAVREGIAALRRARTDPFIAADFITGFPGETRDEHAETVRLAEAARFASLHVFPYSPRPGTAAASLKPFVPQRVRDERAGDLTALSRIMNRDYARAWLGREVGVLLEGPRVGRRIRPSARNARGVADNYLKVRVVDLPPETPMGRIARARITACGEVCEAAFLGFA